MDDHKRTVFGYPAPTPAKPREGQGEQRPGRTDEPPGLATVVDQAPPMGQHSGSPGAAQPPMSQDPGHPGQGSAPVAQPPGQPYPGQPPAHQPPGQPHPGQPYANQPLGQPYPGQPYPGQPYPAQPPGQPYPGQPPTMGQNPNYPYPAQPPMGQQPGQPYPGAAPGMAPPAGQPYPHAAYVAQNVGYPAGVKRVNPALFVIAFLGGFLGSAALTAWGLTDSKVDELLMVSWMPAFVAAIFFWVLLYKSWSAIHDGHARTTPGKALGFMFIPFFNIYWAFIAIGSWGREFNAFADRHQLAGFRASAGLFIAHCVLMLVPYVGMLAVPFTGTIITLQFCRGINAVASRGLPVAQARV